MLILLVIYLALLSMAITSGFKNCGIFAFHIDINKFNSPYFCLGLDYHREYTPNSEISVVVMGLVFINIVFEFYKFPFLTEEEENEIKKKIKDSTNSSLERELSA